VSATGGPVPHSSYRDQVLADITGYEPGDRQELLTFRRAMYGSEASVADEAYVRWLYEDPTYSISGGTPLWLYRKDGRIEAQEGAVRVALKLGQQYHNALWTMDLMVSPKFRLRGVGAVLAEVAYQEMGLLLGVEVSTAARKAFLRAGWIDTGTVPLYVRPLDASALLGNRWDSHKGRIMGQCVNVALRATEVLGRASTSLDGIEVEEVTRFDERADQIWELASPAYPVICRRDSNYLNWRFARFPHPDRYRLFYFSRRGIAVGYTVLRDSQHHGLPAGYIVDFLCSPGWTYSLLAHCLRFFHQKQVKVVACLHHNPDPVARAAFAALGFLRRDSSWPLMLRARDLAADSLALAADQRNWFITAGDSDLDRPREGTVYASDLGPNTTSTSHEATGS
jgi:hypothetical protein